MMKEEQNPNKKNNIQLHVVTKQEIQRFRITYFYFPITKEKKKRVFLPLLKRDSIFFLNCSYLSPT